MTEVAIDVEQFEQAATRLADLGNACITLGMTELGEELLDLSILLHDSVEALDNPEGT